MAICKLYNADNQQCMGGPAWRGCKCEGNQANCDFFPDIKRKAQKEPKQVKELEPDIVENLKAKIKDLEMRLSDCTYDVKELTSSNNALIEEVQRLEDENRQLKLDEEYFEGFHDAVQLLIK